MAESKCRNNKCDVVDFLFNDLKCCIKELEAKKLQLCDAATATKKFETRLPDMSSLIEDAIKSHETAHARYTENYLVLWSKYQNKKKELENVNCLKARLNVNIDDMNKQIRYLGCWLNKKDENNKSLETEICRLKGLVDGDKNFICQLENAIQNRIQCSEKIAEELNATEQKFEEKNHEVIKESEESRKLKCKIESVQNELLKKVEQSKVLEIQLTKDKDMLKTEIQMQKNRNAELNKILCEQKTERQELTVALEKSNGKIDALKQTLENVRVQTQRCIDELRKEKSNVEKEREELDRETEQQTEELKRLECENKQLRTRMDDLQLKFGTIIKSSEETQTLSTEKIAKINCDTKNLMIEMTSKNQTIKELEDKLSKAERTRKTEIENFYCFKRELEKLKQKHTLMPLKCNSNSCTDSFQPSDHAIRVLDALKLDRKMCMDYNDRRTDVHSPDLEEVFTKCDSLLNCFTK